MERTAIDELRTLVATLDYEWEWVLQSIPTIPALLEYRELWDVYGTDYLAGILEEIREGADPKPLRRFMRKHGLKWEV